MSRKMKSFDNNIIAPKCLISLSSSQSVPLDHECFPPPVVQDQGWPSTPKLLLFW